MGKRSKKSGWNDAEWMAVDNALSFEMWSTIDQIASDASIRPGITRSILEEMARNSEVIRRGKKYKRL
jgi:hypothetical protein